MDEDRAFLKFRELVERTGLPESDVKRYLRTFGDFFTSTKEGRTRLFAPDSVDRLKQIAELDVMGTANPTIRGILRGGQAEAAGQGDPAPGAEAGSLAAMGETLTLGVLADVKNLQETVQALQEEVNALRDRVAEHDQRLIGNHQQIRLLRHDVDEQKTEALAKRMEGSTPFWKRILFGKSGFKR